MTEFSPIGGGEGPNGNEVFGVHRQRTLHPLLAHDNPSPQRVERFGVVRKQMLHVPISHGYPTGGGSTPVVHYQMIGRQISDGSWVAWAVVGTPDTTGAQAPSPVVVSTITTTRRWVT